MRRTRGMSGSTVVFDTGLIGVISDDPNNDVANPITQTMRAIDIKDLMLDIFIAARTNAQVRIGIQFSDNPIDFAGAVQKEFTTGYITTAGWTYGGTWVDVWNLTGLSNADYKMFARIVALVKTTMSSTKLESMLLRVKAFGKPIRPRTVSTPWILANSAGSGTGAFHPCTGALPTDGVAFHRVLTDLAGDTDVSALVRWQETNTPDEVSSWTAGGAIGSALTANGVNYPGKIVAVTPTKRYMRYGLEVSNGAGSEVEAVQARMIIDQRDR